MTVEQLNRKVNDLTMEVTSLKIQIGAKLGIVPIRIQSDHERLNLIVSAVEKAYNLSDGIVFSGTQRQPISEARMMCIVFAFKYLKMKRRQIAQAFKMYDSCVPYALKIIANRVELEKPTREKYQSVEKYLNEIS